MSAGDTAGGGTGLARKDPPVRRHGTRLVNCLSEAGQRRVVVYEPDEQSGWIDAAAEDVSDLSERR